MRLAGLTLGLGLFGVGLCACGSSYPTPTDQYAAAEKDVGRAQEGGAANVPTARLHLQLAQEDLGKAKALMNDDNQRATTLVARASAEAELAVDLARQADAESKAEQASAALQKAQSGNP